MLTARDEILKQQRLKALSKSSLPCAFGNTKPITIPPSHMSNVVKDTPGPGSYQKPEVWKALPGGKMTQSARIPEKKSQNPDVDLVGQLSSLNQKGGTIFEKRNTKVQAGPDYYVLPGEKPKGSYIGEKRQESRKNFLPGPGQYTINRESFLKTQSSKFSQLQEKSQKISVGPGEYDISRKPQGTNGYIAQKVQSVQKDATPGPGSYDATVISGKSFSIATKPLEKSSIGPGPGDHQKVGEWVTTAGGLMSKSNRNDLNKVETHDIAMQPQKSTLNGKGGKIFDRNENKVDPTPGPTYIPDTQPKGGYIGQKREAAPERGTAPGPGQYEISRDRIFQNVSAKFSQMQERQPKPTVGPGEYNVVVQKRGGSLLIQERHKKPARETAPGPGAYF
ncbi:SHIPPO 1-like protein [Spironucleus salmonicida]|uniref:SHIPPO 1-like protein n=1 Tax=Spironucleus salmonicida TaxID=348837 RepID=V6LK66_9EUKA|nr:SHIPPO 1-like protein [Spironucleus salmonicida]|eukprot:EST44131.1 SHIPPO 1-like protein [Spironucleus salmonicida]